MAKQIEDIIVKLGLQGFEGLDKIRSSFRDLSKVTQMSDKDITSARDALFDFAKTAGNTEAVNKGLISAFQGLRTQADICGKAYQELSRDLQRLSEVQRGATDTLMAQRQAVLASTAAGTRNVAALQQQRAALIALRAQTRDSSAAFIQFSTDIQAVETRLTNLATVNSRLNSALSRARAGTSAGARAELVAIDNGIAALRQEIDAIDLLNSKTRALAATQQQRLAIEERVNTALAARRQLQFQEATRTARETVRTGAETFNSRDLTQGPLSAQNISQRLGDLPNTTAGLSQELSELNERLINTYRNTETYIGVQLRLAAVQRELTSVTQGYGAALLADLNAGTLIPSQKNLAEVIGQLRREMLELDQTTTEGSRAYAQNANQVRLLEQQLNQLANAYGNVADKARTAAAQGTNPFTPSGARNPAYVREQLAALEAALGTVDASNLDAVDALLNAKRTLYEYEAQVSAQLDQQKEQLAAQELARVDAQDKKEDAAFKRELNRLDILKQQTAAAREALGFDTQRELSPLYRQITGMATAGVARQQQFMGRSPSQVLNDIASSFNAGGRGVDLKQRSTEIGGSVAEGVAQGAADSAATATGAKNFADKLITAYKQAFRIKSPSGKSKDEIGIPIGQGIGLGIIEGIKSLRARVQLAIKDVTATPGRAALPVGGGPVSDVADRLQSFLARTSAKTSTFLPLTRLMGEGVTGSAALPLAVYRRSYERGGIVAPSFLPVEQRRGLRGTPGIPGAGLEEIIRAEAFRAVSRTGAFVGPLSGPQTAGGAASSAYRAGISPGTFQRPFTAGVSQPLFAAATQLAPLQRTLPGMAYRMGGSQFAFPTDGPLGGGRSLTFGRSGANASVTQSIRTYRKAVDSFWAEETESFEAIRRVLSSDAQLSASKLARNLTETRNTTAALTTAAVQLASVPGATFTKLGAAVREELSEIKQAVASAGQDLTSGAQRVRQSVAGAGGAVRNAVSPLLGGRFGGAVPPGSGGGGGASPAANNEFTKLNATLTQFGALSRRSVTDIRDLGSVLDELRNNLSPLDAEYKQVNKRIEAQQVLIERELGRRERRASRRLSGMQLAQGVGAALSGGIFGGPEGLIGGLGGLAVGGVGGAFAGAAFGAQVAMLRQAGAAAATYAAEVRRLQLALQGIVGTFDDYKAALAAVDSASRTYNVPVREATQQFTKLSAAVLGSGGTIKDAENTFKGLTASVLATGGSVQDINGALVAAAQVFSKGKVTAEELRGQIGERLAGAFALFAESSNRSTRGLDAALNDGEVTIADFVKFTEFSLAKYGRTAQIIAASPEQAGARLDNALKALQKNVGDSLGPAGASFQDFATRAINGLDKVINKLAELKAIQPGAGYYVQQVLGGALTIPDLEQQVARAGARESALRQNASSAGLGFIANLLPDISAATKEARILEEALIKVRLIEKETNKDRKQRQTEEADALKERLGASYLQAFEQREEAIAQARVQREEQIADIRKQALEQARQLERQFADERRALERDIEKSKRGAADIEEDIARQRRIMTGEDPRIIEAEQTLADIYREARDRDIQIKEEYADREFTRARTLSDFQKKTADDINKANESYAKTIGNIQRQYAVNVAKIIDEGSGNAGKRLEAAGKIAALYLQRSAFNAQLISSTGFAVAEPGSSGAGTLPANIFMAPEVAEPNRKLAERVQAIDKQIQELQGLMQKAAPAFSRAPTLPSASSSSYRVGGTTGAQAQRIPVIPSSMGAAEASGAARDAAQTTSGKQTDLALLTRRNQALDPINQQVRRLQEQNDLFQAQQRYIEDGVTPALAEQYAQIDQTGRLLTSQFAEFKDDIQASVQSAKDLAAAYEQVQRAARFTQDDRIGLGLREGAEQYVQSIGTMREATAQLAQTGIKGVEDAIFSLVTTGTANFREFAASILKDTARMIIQQMILRSVMQIIGAVGGGGASASATSANYSQAQMMTDITAFPIKTNALGNAFAANGIVPFAMGGLVDRPTLFKFANGGAGRLGLMGEAGPEAIMPLRRLPSGRLGVEAAGGSNSAPVNVTVNVDANGTSVQGDAGQGEQLGRVISQAVQAELVRQKRPGGLLAA